MSRTFAAVAALTLILASSAASAQMLKTADTPKGKTFVDGKGMIRARFEGLTTRRELEAAVKLVLAPEKR